MMSIKICSTVTTVMTSIRAVRISTHKKCQPAKTLFLNLMKLLSASGKTPKRKSSSKCAKSKIPCLKNHKTIKSS